MHPIDSSKIVVSSQNVARPKSRSVTLPLRASYIKLSIFTSRCRTPEAWMCFNATNNPAMIRWASGSVNLRAGLSLTREKTSRPGAKGMIKCTWFESRE